MTASTRMHSSLVSSALDRKAASSFAGPRLGCHRLLRKLNLKRLCSIRLDVFVGRIVDYGRIFPVPDLAQDLDDERVLPAPVSPMI